MIFGFDDIIGNFVSLFAFRHQNSLTYCKCFPYKNFNDVTVVRLTSTEFSIQVEKKVPTFSHMRGGKRQQSTMKLIIVKKRWILMFSLSFLIYAFVYMMAIVSTTGPEELVIQVVDHVPYETVKPVWALDPEPVLDDTGHRTSMLKAEMDYVVPNVVHYIWYGDHEPMR